MRQEICSALKAQEASSNSSLATIPKRANACWQSNFIQNLYPSGLQRHILTVYHTALPDIPTTMYAKVSVVHDSIKESTIMPWNTNWKSIILFRPSRDSNAKSSTLKILWQYTQFPLVIKGTHGIEKGVDPQRSPLPISSISFHMFQQKPSVAIKVSCSLVIDLDLPSQETRFVKSTTQLTISTNLNSDLDAFMHFYVVFSMILIMACFYNGWTRITTSTSMSSLWKRLQHTMQYATQGIKNIVAPWMMPPICLGARLISKQHYL